MEDTTPHPRREPHALPWHMDYIHPHTNGTQMRTGSRGTVMGWARVAADDFGVIVSVYGPNGQLDRTIHPDLVAT